MAMESDNGIGKWQMQMYGMNRVVLSGETRVVVCGMQHMCRCSFSKYEASYIKKYELNCMSSTKRSTVRVLWSRVSQERDTFPLKINYGGHPTAAAFGCTKG